VAKQTEFRLVVQALIKSDTLKAIIQDKMADNIPVTETEQANLIAAAKEYDRILRATLNV
jgi:hypothetical protein